MHFQQVLELLQRVVLLPFLAGLALEQLGLQLAIFFMRHQLTNGCNLEMKTIVPNHGFLVRLPESLLDAIKSDQFFDDFWDAIYALKHQPTLGLEKIEKCVENGSIVSAYVLGDILFFGYQGISNPERGFEIIKYAADRMSIEAMYSLSQIYFSWNDVDAAKRELLELTSLNFAPAMFNLGGIYRKEGDLIRARRYFELAEMHGHVPSINNLSILMINGSYGFISRFVGFFKWVKNMPNAINLMRKYPRSDLLRGGDMKKFGHIFPDNGRMSLAMIENIDNLFK
jgi:TPR repeat protein